MKLKRARLLNYKSYKEAEIDINGFTVLVGANASGKSNFISALRLLRDAGRYGISDALALQGGLEFIRNKYAEDSVTLEYEFDVDNLAAYTSNFEHASKKIAINSVNLCYTLQISGDKQRPTFAETARVEYVVTARTGTSVSEVGRGVYRLKKGSDATMSAHHVISDELKQVGVTKKKVVWAFTPYLTLSEDLKSRFLVGDKPFISHSDIFMNGIDLESFSFFDFDPKLAKQSSKFAGKRELEEDGSNFNVAMKYVLEEEENKVKFKRTLGDFLPFITNFKVNQSMDQSLLSMFSENGHTDHNFPSYAMSDGTMYLASLVLGVGFSKSKLIVVEEPEKYIHPSLAIKVIDYLRSASKEKQIIITSHSPQIVKYAGVESLTVVVRKENGSDIVRAKDIPHVAYFLSTDMGLDQVFANNLLAM